MRGMMKVKREQDIGEKTGQEKKSRVCEKFVWKMSAKYQRENIME